MKFGLTLSVLFVCLAFPRISNAVSVGQTDTFQDGTTQNWQNGGVGGINPVVNIATGGPAGLGDKFIQITSAGGGGPGGRLVAFNRLQWQGNYIAAGVTSIEMDLMNSGATTLSIRIAFRLDPTFGAPGYLSTSIELAPGQGWEHAVFSLSPNDLIPVDSPPPYDDFFTGPGEFRILSEVGTGSLNGDPVAGVLGVDNIMAVPEPGTFALLPLAGLPLALKLRRRRA